MSKVFVLDTRYKPLAPVHPGYARKLLFDGKAAVFRRYPFTIIRKDEVEQPVAHPLRLKIDPGSQTTGLALVNDATGEVVWSAQLTHRGQAIKAALDKRRCVRRSRRQRKTRYRQPRFDNRRRKEGCLPPSLESRVANIETWIRRLMRFCPIQALSQELVKFDMQAMDTPEIQESEYQQGELAGYEVREYLLEKWNRQCAYCGTKEVPLQTFKQVISSRPLCRQAKNKGSTLDGLPCVQVAHSTLRGNTVWYRELAIASVASFIGVMAIAIRKERRHLLPSPEGRRVSVPLF